MTTRLRRRLGHELYSLLVLVCSYLPAVLFHKLCELDEGHRYTAAVLHGDGSWVIDPTSRCVRCSLPMSENVYASLTAAYAEAWASDEAWD